ncbi:MAG: hypothetical protein FWF15_11435 [Oscillospiraceae bacterium]|nr:hypothetical protein [Oscillospiraceae bacterium]
MDERIYAAAELRRAVQYAIGDVEDESLMMEFASVYEKWETGKQYAAGKIIKYGVNQWGETQLWKVISPHTSQQSWAPDTAVSLYYRIGFTDSGIPIWTQPNGAHDAYDKGDKVEHKGNIWESDYDGKNVWEPGVYGWEEVMN